MTDSVVDKVVAYVTRERNGKIELLVFDHDKNHSDAGTQVPAGTVDHGETPEQAVLREAVEETGLQYVSLSQKLETYAFFNTFQNQKQRRHVFHLLAKNDSADAWSHVVSGGELDKGMTFHCYWVSLQEAEEKLAAGLANSIPILRKRIEKSRIDVFSWFFEIFYFFR